MRFAFLSLCFVIVGAGLAQAQTLTTSSGVAVYRYANPGQPTMDIRLWGAVSSPGVYQVERDLDLIEVLTLAGGPAIPSQDDRTIQRMDIDVLRESGANRTVVFTTTLGGLTAADTVLPDLQDGDLVTLTAVTRQRFTWRDALGVAGSIAGLAVLILRFTE